MESDNQPRERSIPITTTQGNLTTTHFPLTSTSSNSGASSPFNSVRDNIFNQLHQFRKNQDADEMFTDSPFASMNHPMNLNSRHTENFFSHGHSEDAESGQELHQPRVFNIPIQVETAEGVVHLSRTNSHSPGSFQHRNHSYHVSPTPGGGPVGSKSSSPIPGDHTRHRPGPSPTPPPKPKFIPSFKPEAESYAQPHHSHSQQHRVHTVPVKLEKSSKLSDHTSVSNQEKQDRKSSPIPDQKSSCESRSFGYDTPDSQHGGGPHVVNIPVNFNRNQESESLERPPSQSTFLGDSKKGPDDQLDLIKQVEDEACRLEKEVMEFFGEGQDKKYRYLDEMLTRCMLKLDNIDTCGRDDVRSARKSALARVDRVIVVLEQRAAQKQLNEEQVKTLANKIENECNMQQLSHTDSSIESEPVENQKQDSIRVSEAISDQTNEPDKMEVDVRSSQSEKGSEEQADANEEEEETNEAIEEDPAGDDGSSKDFINCNNRQLSNKNICRTTEEVIVEEMAKKESPEKPS